MLIDRVINFCDNEYKDKSCFNLNCTCKDYLDDIHFQCTDHSISDIFIKKLIDEFMLLTEEIKKLGF